MMTGWDGAQLVSNEAMPKSAKRENLFKFMMGLIRTDLQERDESLGSRISIFESTGKTFYQSFICRNLMVPSIAKNVPEISSRY